MSSRPRISFRKRSQPELGAAVRSDAGVVAMSNEELVVEGVLTPRDETVFLLQTAAEIEHALLVQYLYAAYSIDVEAAPTSEERTQAGTWQHMILNIAIEEMAHLISMQNLLLFLGGPTNLERQDFPFRELFYPFHFKLEPFSLDSLAKYIVAEMPDITAPDETLHAIIDRATGATGGVPINRVGALFERIDALFDELTEADVFPSSAQSHQGTPDEWSGSGRRIVRTVETLLEAQELANAIAVQGEGGEDTEDSHYGQFRTIYKQFEAMKTWQPARSIPVNPNTADDPHEDPEMEAGRITDEESRRWAFISDLQYRLLLYSIAHSVILDRQTDAMQMDARRDVIQWAFFAMHSPGLAGVIDHLQTLPQHTGGGERKAGAPFAIPYTLAVSHDAVAQWQTYVDIIDATQTLLNQTTSGSGLKSSLESINRIVRSKAIEYGNAAKSNVADPVDPSEPPPAPGDGSQAREDFIELLKSKLNPAQFVHGGVTIPGGGTLNELFASENYDAIIDFLLTADSQRPPSSGKRLIVPGSPAQSGFYVQITEGVMLGRFVQDEVDVVERWIRSLPTNVTGQSRRAAVAEMRANRSAAKQIVANQVATGLDQPVFVTAPKGDTDRLFIVEKQGAIKTMDLSTGQVGPVPLLQVEDLSTGGERGLLGLAFHPKFSENGLLFVNVTDHAGRTTIRRYQKDGNTVDPDSRVDVLVVDQPFANHNGGWLDFGPSDGLLYIALGDGGSANDPLGNAQKPGRLLGKMLRVDVDRDDFPSAPQINYGIPPSNPFVSDTQALDEIWAMGLRNPWRCSFDSLTGDLWIADVGQSAREEINFQNANSRGGENYGWRIREGSLPTGLDPNVGSFVDPIHEYGRSDGGAIIGGYVYRGEAIDGLHGTYFYADFLSSRIWSLRFDGTSLSNHVERTGQLNANHSLNSINSFGQDGRGELYIVSMAGELYRIDAI